MEADRHAPTLLSLAPEALYLVFDGLAHEPATAGTRESACTALASTCRALNKLYRIQYVHTLHFDRTVSPVHVVRALQRFPNAVTLRFSPLLRGNKRLRVDYDSPMPGSLPVGVGASIRHLSLNTATLMPGGFSSIPTLFPALETLQVDRCFPFPSGEMTAFVSAAPVTLRKLSLIGLYSMSEANTMDSIGGLMGLTSLRLRSCWCAPGGGAITLDFLHSLTALEELDLFGSLLSEESLIGVLPHLRQLRVLDIGENRHFSGAILSALPCTLTVLRVQSSIQGRGHETDLLSDDTPAETLGALTRLEELDARSRKKLTHWRVLAPLVVAPLQDLNLGYTRVSDTGVEEVLGRMRALRRLNLCGTLCGDGTAWVAATLPRLEFLNMSETRLTDIGVSALGCGDAAASLEDVRLTNCRRLHDDVVARTIEQLHALRYAELPKLLDNRGLSRRALRAHRRISSHADHALHPDRLQHGLELMGSPPW